MTSTPTPDTASGEALRRIVRAANKLAAAAMTTGGTAGADPHLQEAIDAFIAARDAAMQSPTGEPT